MAATAARAASRHLQRCLAQVAHPSATRSSATVCRVRGARVHTSTASNPVLPPVADPTAASPDTSVPPASGKRARSGSVLGMYAELSKARLSSLVVFTSGAGFLMSGITCLHSPLAALALGTACMCGTALASASAGTLNQLSERNSDALMKRTASRPLPAGRISVPHAQALAGALGAASVVALAQTNPVTLALGVANIGLYAGVYTPLKSRSEWNTAVGAVVGAVPPVMGWTAAVLADTPTDALMDISVLSQALLAPEPALLFLTLFWWQFPHFHSLAYTLRRDYARAGIRMRACVGDGSSASASALACSVALAALPFAAAASGVTSPMFAVEGALLNAALLRYAWAFHMGGEREQAARKLFKASLIYLPLLLILAVFHSSRWRAVEKRDVGEAEPFARAVTTARAVGRALCVHEIAAKGDATATPTSVIQSVVAVVQQGDAPLAAPPPESSDAAASAAVARDAVRARCPVEHVRDAAVAVPLVAAPAGSGKVE